MPEGVRRRHLRRGVTVVKAIKTGKPIVGVEPGREALVIFGMTPIMRDGKTLANVDVGAAFGKEFVDRAKKRFGIDLAVYSYDGKDSRSCPRPSAMRGRPRRRAQGRVRRPALRRDARSQAGPPRSISGRSRITPASRSAFSKSSRTRPNTRRRGEFAAQPDPRHGRHPDRRDPAGVAARPRAVAAVGAITAVMNRLSAAKSTSRFPAASAAMNSAPWPARSTCSAAA
jgi:hypothetical protein